MARIITEGWRFLPHSYAIVNQFQLLEMSQRPELELFQKDLRYYLKHWQHTTGIFSEQEEQIIINLPKPTTDQNADALYRICFPFDLQTNPKVPTYVFCTSEYGNVNSSLKNQGSISEQLKKSPVRLVTPSHWSKQGFVRCGANPDRISVIPHGVDTSMFRPLPDNERIALRQKLGWDQYFIFLHTGAMTDNKGINTIVKSLATIAEKKPHVRLVLKGLNSLYKSQNFVDTILKDLSESEKHLVLPRIIFSGNTFTFAEMAQLHQAADAYISPYLAEGFNMPVMEAAACGLPVICTEGGPTDEFTTPDFTLRISSHPTQAINLENERVYFLTPSQEHTIDLMCKVIDNPKIGQLARNSGPRFMAENFTWKHIVDQLLATILK